MINQLTHFLSTRLGSYRKNPHKSEEQLNRIELDEARETLRAISVGEVDAVVENTKDGDKIFTLKSAEHPYRVMVEAMNEGAVTLLQDGTIMYCNYKFANLLQFSTDEIAGKKLSDFVANKDRASIALMCSRSAIKPSKGEIFLVAADSTPIDVHISMGPVDFAGIPAISMIVTDLTERKQNETLTESENLTRSIFDQAELLREQHLSPDLHK